MKKSLRTAVALLVLTAGLVIFLSSRKKPEESIVGSDQSISQAVLSSRLPKQSARETSEHSFLAERTQAYPAKIRVSANKLLLENKANKRLSISTNDIIQAFPICVRKDGSTNSELVKKLFTFYKNKSDFDQIASESVSAIARDAMAKGNLSATNQELQRELRSATDLVNPLRSSKTVNDWVVNAARIEGRTEEIITRPNKPSANLLNLLEAADPGLPSKLDASAINASIFEAQSHFLAFGRLDTTSELLRKTLSKNLTANDIEHILATPFDILFDGQEISGPKLPPTLWGSRQKTVPNPH